MNLMFVHDLHRRNGEFFKNAGEDDEYINLLPLFHHKEGMYIDCCHYSEEANEKIAECVYRTIKDEL